MNSIAIDFKNEMMCIMRPEQQGTEHINGLGITKEKLADFIPEKYRSRQSFTWNFEDSTFAVNADYEYHPERGEIMTMDWLAENVIGSIPKKEELTEHAEAVIKQQGVIKKEG